MLDREGSAKAAALSLVGLLGNGDLAELVEKRAAGEMTPISRRAEHGVENDRGGVAAVVPASSR